MKIMAKKEKKIDVKAVAKTSLMKTIKESLEQLEIQVLDGDKFGFTSGTIVVRMGETDIQLKPIAPKSGVTRYEEVAEDGE